MDAYFLKINRLSAASLQSLHRRLLISSFHQLHVPGRRSIDQGDFTDAQPPEETPSTQTTPSTQWDLHLSVTSKHVNRTLPTPSRRWKELQTEILLRNKRTCSSCGYLSPHPEGRHMVIDHKDGNALNNYSLNLMLLCPPCHAIRHCGFSGLQDWITVSKSTMKQIEIVRKTREIFEKTGVIPHPYRIDPSVKLVRISAVELANMLLTTPWKYLPEGYQSLRGFFTKQSSRLFQYTMLNENLDTYVCFFNFNLTVSYISYPVKCLKTIRTSHSAIIRTRHCAIIRMERQQKLRFTKRVVHRSAAQRNTTNLAK